MYRAMNCTYLSASLTVRVYVSIYNKLYINSACALLSISSLVTLVVNAIYYLIDSSGDAMFMSCLDLLQASIFSFSAIKRGPQQKDMTILSSTCRPYRLNFKLSHVFCF